MGVNIKKKINPIIIGLINLPIISPNLIHNFVNGDSNFGLKITNTKNIIAITSDQILSSLFESKGQREMTIKKRNNKIPKDLLLFCFI